MSQFYLKDEVVVFGAGSGLTEILNKKMQFSISYIVDNSPEKWGTTYLGFRIESPDKLLSLDKEKYSIVICSPRYKEIAAQLNEMGFSENIHYFYFYLMNRDAEEIESRFKNKHIGQRAFLIGNGPSLKLEDLEKLQNEVTFAANKIYLAFGETDWRPSYYFVEDKLVGENNYNEISKLEETKFLAWHIHEYFQDVQDQMKNVYWINYDRRVNVVVDSGFSEDFASCFCGGKTVIYMMLQAAYYMGIREIYLIGVDFSFKVPKDELLNSTDVKIISEGEVNHFHPDYRKVGEKWYAPALETQHKSFSYAKDFFEKNGGSIINCSRTTKLDVFQIKSLDEIL